MLPNGDDAGEGAEKDTNHKRDQHDLPAVDEEIAEQVHIGNKGSQLSGNEIHNGINENKRKNGGEKSIDRSVGKIRPADMPIGGTNEAHDFNFKVRNMQRFLEEGNKVKATITFRGRELAHVDIGSELMKRIIAQFENTAVIESTPKLEGKNLFTVFASKPK